MERVIWYDEIKIFFEMPMISGGGGGFIDKGLFSNYFSIVRMIRIDL